jgi:glyoxylase I family protein
MTATAEKSEISTNTGPGLLGLSHLGVTVRDVPAAQRFWTGVMGFSIAFEAENFSMLLERSAGLAIGLTNQEGQAAGVFDEHHIGLDHLALAVADVPTLFQWEQWLSDKDIEHSPVATSDAGHHLNLRAPDNFPIELFVLSEQGAADLGLTTGQTPVAGGHAIT